MSSKVRAHFAEQFWLGDFYPRWLQNMNYGLGSASFFIYPPFPSYVYALLLPVAKVIHLDAFSLGEYFCLLMSGVSAFQWMTTLVSRRASVIGGRPARLIFLATTTKEGAPPLRSWQGWEPRTHAVECRS
jgi:hypothetical protein